MLYNRFDTMPFYLYRIVLQLLNNDNLCKLLKYNTYECLSMPNLTADEKAALIWKNQDRMEEYHIFLTNTKANMVTEAMDIMQVYRYDTSPKNPILATICYRFDFLFGSKTALVEYEGVPCNRGDVFEMELMKSLNGQDIAGVGFLQYNEGLSRLCGSQVGIGNNSTFTGISVVMATMNGDVGDGGCNE